MWLQGLEPRCMMQVEISSAKDGVDTNGVKEGVPARWWNALVPISLVTFFVLLALILTGKDAVDADPDLKPTADNIFGAGSSYQGMCCSLALRQQLVAKRHEHALNSVFSLSCSALDALWCMQRCCGARSLCQFSRGLASGCSTCPQREACSRSGTSIRRPSPS